MKSSAAHRRRVEMRDKYKTISTTSALDLRSTPVEPILDVKNVADNLDQINMWIINTTRAREIDLQDFDNQQSANVSIYKAAPSSSSDLKGTEQVGDISADTNYLYVVVDNAGALEWQRVAIATF